MDHQTGAGEHSEPAPRRLVLPVGTGPTPIERDVIDESGDVALWAELDEMFSVRLESL
jgi:hypothetical protein